MADVRINAERRAAYGSTNLARREPGIQRFEHFDSFAQNELDCGVHGRAGAADSTFLI